MTIAHLVFAAMSTCFMLIELLFGDGYPGKDFEQDYSRPGVSDTAVIPHTKKPFKKSPGEATAIKAR